MRFLPVLSLYAAALSLLAQTPASPPPNPPVAATPIAGSTPVNPTLTGPDGVTVPLEITPAPVFPPERVVIQVGDLKLTAAHPCPRLSAGKSRHPGGRPQTHRRPDRSDPASLSGESARLRQWPGALPVQRTGGPRPAPLRGRPAPQTHRNRSLQRPAHVLRRRHPRHSHRRRHQAQVPPGRARAPGLLPGPQIRLGADSRPPHPHPRAGLSR